MFGRGISPYGAYGISAATKTGINWSSLLTNTQKTLSVINQAIPAFYQIKPIFGNMKTMFRIVTELNKDDKKRKNTTSFNVTDKSNTINQTDEYDSLNQIVYSSEDGPSFFV